MATDALAVRGELRPAVAGVHDGGVSAVRILDGDAGALYPPHASSQAALHRTSIRTLLEPL